MRKGSKIDKYYEKVMLVLRKFLFIRCAFAKYEFHMCDREYYSIIRLESNSPMIIVRRPNPRRNMFGIGTGERPRAAKRGQPKRASNRAWKTRAPKPSDAEAKMQIQVSQDAEADAAGTNCFMCGTGQMPDPFTCFCGLSWCCPACPSEVEHVCINGAFFC